MVLSMLGTLGQKNTIRLYEEYRGFIIEGQHEDADQADPQKKDFFIVNAAGPVICLGALPSGPVGPPPIDQVYHVRSP